jgi:hypothetical protein
MMENFCQKRAAITQFYSTFQPFFSHDIPLLSNFDPKGFDKFEQKSESFDSGGKKYV